MPLQGPGAEKEAAAAAAALQRLRSALADVEAVEHRLRSQTERYRSILAALVEGVVVQDTTGAIVGFNDSAPRLLGLTPEQLTGRRSIDPRWQAIHPDGSPFPGEEHPSMVTLRTGEPMLGVLMGVRIPAGETRWISINTQPLRESPEGVIEGVVCSFQDVTARRRQEAAIRASEERFRQLSAQAPIGIFLTDPEGRCRYVNERWCAITGISPEQAMDDGWADGIHPDDRAGLLAAWHAFARDPVRYSHEVRALRPDGTVRWLHVSAQPVRDGAGVQVGYVGCVDDVTERRLAEEERERFFELAVDLLAVADPSGRFLRLSRSFETTLGWTREELLATNFFDFVHPDDVEATRDVLKRMLEGVDCPAFVNRYRCKDGSWKWLQWSGPAPRADSRLIYAVARDVTAERREGERLQRLAESDSLTGLPNRTRLELAIEAALMRAPVERTGFAVLWADLDGFKPVNDRHGHAAGDEALREIAQRLRHAVRGTDVVARVGGDEFVVVLEGVGTRGVALEVATKLERAVAAPLASVGESLGLSVGIALHPDDGGSPAELLAAADRAMYRVKRERGARDADPGERQTG